MASTTDVEDGYASRSPRESVEREFGADDDDWKCEIRVRVDEWQGSDDGDGDARKRADGATVMGDAPEAHRPTFRHAVRATLGRALSLRDDRPPSKQVVHHDVLGAFMKGLVLGTALVALSCVLAGCLYAYEGPREREMHAQMSATQAEAARAVTELFDFIDDPLTRGLTVDAVTPSCADSYRGYLLPEVTENGKTYPGGIDMIIPQYEPAPEVYRHKESDVVTCTSLMDGECRLKCLLQKPELKQVQACRSQEASMLNPAKYDDECLRSDEKCPNCHLLRRRISNLSYWAVASSSDSIVQVADVDPHGDRFVQAAALYVRYKEQEEAQVQVINWNFSGAFHFASTVFSTVGYGKYNPETNESKICMIFLMLPGIVIFGFAITQVSEVMLGIVMWALQKLRLTKQRMKIETSPSEWAAALRKIDGDRDGFLTLKEVNEGVHEIYNSLGLVDVMNASSKELSATDLSVAWLNRNLHIGHENSTFAEASVIASLFEEEDTDGAGRIDMMQGMILMSKLIKLYEAKEKELQAREELVAALSIFTPLILASAFGFQALEANQGFHYSVLDSFYYCMLSFTTIGLGDITPSHGPSEWYWYVYMMLSLGTLASILSSFTTVLASRKRQRKIAKPYRDPKVSKYRRSSLYSR